jgi:hypothetical protein
MPQKLSENMQICLGGSVILQPSVQVQATISGDFFLDLLDKTTTKMAMQGHLCNNIQRLGFTLLIIIVLIYGVSACMSFFNT